MARRQRDPARAELAEFLRTRRERVMPADVGLMQTGRRRTPGLRREEVAQAAGVGVTWYTWLEQGRQITVSAHFLDCVARALRLDPTERAHLFTLAQDRRPAGLPEPAVGPALRRMLETIAGPAYIATATLDVVAWNTTLAAVFGDLSPLPAADRNMLWLMFSSPAHRAAIPNWEETARAMLARFRVEFGRDRTDTRFKSLVERLEAASPEFRAWWPEHHVSFRSEGPKRFTIPGIGEMALDQNTFLLEQMPGMRLVVYSPADEASAARMAALCRRRPTMEQKPRRAMRQA